MSLYPFSASQLTYLDSGEFIVRYITDIENQGIDLSVDPDFKEMHLELVAQSPIFNLALSQIKARAESQALLKLDVSRDKKISTLRKAFGVAKNSDDAAEQVAYDKIKIVFNAYKGIESLNFPAESLAITNLISELRNGNHLPAVQVLGLMPHINNLETANTNFITTFDSRSTSVISTEVYDTKALRKKILATYNDLANYIQFKVKRTNNAYYNSVLTSVNYSRKYFANLRSGATPVVPPAAT